MVFYGVGNIHEQTVHEESTGGLIIQQLKCCILIIFFI